MWSERRGDLKFLVLSSEGVDHGLLGCLAGGYQRFSDIYMQLFLFLVRLMLLQRSFHLLLSVNKEFSIAEGTSQQMKTRS